MKNGLPKQCFVFHSFLHRMSYLRKKKKKESICFLCVSLKEPLCIFTLMVSKRGNYNDLEMGRRKGGMDCLLSD